LSAKFIIEGSKLDTFCTCLNCGDGGTFQKATDSYQYTLRKGKDSLPQLSIDQIGGFPQWKDSTETTQQLLERRVVLPRRQLHSFETIGQLLIGHQSLLGIVSSDTYYWDPQIVSKEPDGVEYYPLFAKCTGEDGVNLVNDQHVDFKLTR